MSELMQALNAKAARLRIPLGVHLDVTYRCNERCVHCYLDHDGDGEMAYEEIVDLLEQMAAAGVLFLTISGGEPLLRKEIFDIVRRARQLTFNVKLKTNAILIREREAALLRALDVEKVQVSIYSHRPEVHDAITNVPGSLERSLAAIRFLIAQGMRVIVANVLMRQNWADYPRVQDLARELGAEFSIDPTITPHINGARSLLRLNIPTPALRQVMHDSAILGEVGKDPVLGDASKPALAADDDDFLAELPCSAGHSFCYVSPFGDLYPCVQFPLLSGNVRREKFVDIWRQSPQLEEVRSIRVPDLPVCAPCAHVSTCSRCPGLAYMEGNMRGPSTADCEKSLARSDPPPP
ncbi:MAG: radical SAM protein [Candidatus Binatia bacterium]